MLSQLFLLDRHSEIQWPWTGMIANKRLQKGRSMIYTKNQKAFLLVHWFLGALFFTTGLSKFQSGIPTVAAHIVEGFEKTILPKILLVPYAYCLPFAETIVGLLLLLGLFTDVALFVSALLF